MEEEKSKIWIDENGIVNIKIMVKNLSEKDMEELIKEGKEIAKNLTEKALILVDISSGLIAISSRFRRDIAEEIKKLAIDPGFKKLAIFGGVLPRTVASFVITASGVKNMKVFKTKDEALRWLREP